MILSRWYQALAGQFDISSFNSQGGLAWTNAFPTGVCTVETAVSPMGAWLPLLNCYTTGSVGRAALAVPARRAFYRLAATDISATNPNGFNNFTRAYGNLRTLAGSGYDGGVDGINYWLSNFEGGYATNAALSRPHFAMADSAGNVFIVDKDSHSVLKVTPDGRLHTVAGTHLEGNGADTAKLATTVALSSPNGLWVGSDGAVYILDTGNGKVRWLGTNGFLTTLFTVSGGISGGRGLWVKDDRTLVYFVNGSDVKRWTPGGSIKSVNKNNLNDPGNLIVDASGDLIVTDRGANRVYRLPTSGSKAGNLITLYGDGTANAVVDGTPAINNGLYGVRAVWPVPTGGYLLGTHEGSQVLYVDPAGILHILLDGLDGYHSGDGQWFYTPGYKISQARSVTMDAHGNLLVVESDYGFVRQIDFLRLTP